MSILVSLGPNLEDPEMVDLLIPDAVAVRGDPSLKLGIPEKLQDLVIYGNIAAHQVRIL